MFYLTMATPRAVVSPRPPLSAPDALRTWLAEEARWFRVICLDQDHNLVTKGELRELAARAGRATETARPADTSGLAATLARIGKATSPRLAAASDVVEHRPSLVVGDALG